MGGGQTGSQQTQTQQVTQLPPWINDAAQQNFAFAQNAALRPLQQFQGQMVPDTSPQLQQSWNTAATAGAAGLPQFNAATAGYSGALGQTPMTINAAQSKLAPGVTAAQGTLAPNTVAAQGSLSQLGSTNLSKYMDPYTKDVINATLPLMQQQLGLSQNAVQNQANSANAFGGSRQGVQQGVTQAQGEMNMGQMIAQLNDQNFKQAQAAGEFDVGAANNMSQFNAKQLNDVGMNNQTLADAMSQWNAGAKNTVNLADMAAGNNMNQFNATQLNNASQLNQAAKQAKINSDIAAAGGLSTLGGSLAQQASNAFTMQNTAGTQQMGNAQDAINANMAKYNEAWNYPTKQLGVLQSALGMTPYGQSTSGTGSTQTYTPTDWAALAAAGLGAAGSIWAGKPPSDKRLKKNLKIVGKHIGTGVPIYDFNWKGQPPGAPKTRGPMAQDVQKVLPGAVTPHPTRGYLTVHPGVLGALSRPGAVGPVGAMRGAAPVQMRTEHRRRMRPPQIRGALSG